MRIADRLLAALDRVSPPSTVSAHCDLPCGVYDPAQARIEAESIKATMEKFNASNDETFKVRATKTAGESKKTNDVAVAERLLSEIAEIDTIFWATKKG